MSSVRYGIAANQIVPSHDLRLGRDPEGKWTGSQTYTIRQEDKSNTLVLQKLQKGTPITTLYSVLPAIWSGVEVDSFEFNDRSGGWCDILVNFAGYTEGDGFDTDREKTYSIRGVLTERPMIEHPKYLSEVKGSGLESEHKAIVALYSGTAFVVPSTNTINVKNSADHVDIITDMTDPAAVKWYNKIIVDGKRTFFQPSFEWTIEEANSGGLSSSDIADYGKKVNPPGSPPEPTGVDGWWLFADCSDMRSSNASSNSRTYRFMFEEYDEDIYG